MAGEINYDDEEIQRKLASGEYSISPRSGRPRKRIRYDEKKGLSKHKIVKYGKIILLVILITSFIISLLIVIPELNIESDKNINPKKSKNTGQ